MSEQVVLSDGKGIITAMYTPKINDRGMILVAGSLRSDRPINAHSVRSCWCRWRRSDGVDAGAQSGRMNCRRA